MKIMAKSKLFHERLQQGYTASDIAREIGLSDTAIRQIERRVNGISPANAKRVCEFLELKFDDVFELMPRGSKETVK